MAHEPRPAPQVTIRDPARAGEPLDLLEAAPPSRRRRGAVAALVATGLLVAAGVEVADRREATTQERRLGAVLDLTVQPEGGSSSYDPAYRTAHLEAIVLLVNRGPRDLVVLDGSVAGYRLAPREVHVRSGGSARALLQQSVGCSPTQPPDGQDADTLVLQVRTLVDVRTVELPVEAFSGDEAARACGFLPVEEAVSLAVAGATRPAGALELALDVSTRSVRPIELLGVEVGPGLRAQLRHPDGTAAELPLTLPSGAVALRAFTLRVEPADCDAARAGAGSPQLALRVRDEDGRVATVQTLYELGYLLDLLLDACA